MNLKEYIAGKWGKAGIIILVIVLALSLFLRLYAIDVFLAGDETKWICRSINFHNALVNGDWPSTYQSEHPGVITMLTGTLAVPLNKAGEWIGLCQEMGGSKLTRVDDRATLLCLPSLIFQARRALAVITWGGIVVLSLLLQKLFEKSVALLATTLVALDPFHLALSRVLHLDALLTTFMTLSMISLLIYELRDRRRGYLYLSGIMCGLAIANKSPALFLLPFTAMILALKALRGKRENRPMRLKEALHTMIIWSGIAGAVVLLLWPSLWANPVGTLKNVLGAAVEYAEEPHGNSNFFWFAIRPDPGPAFYPVAWLFRTTPWVIVGLILLIVKMIRQKDHNQSVTSMLLFVLLYTLFMTTGAKKFDRYLLPVIPTLNILSALGWMWGLRRMTGKRLRNRHTCAPLLLCGFLAITQLALIWPTQPYYFSYYNPLLGGARTATRILLVGWGEGMEKAAAYLNDKPGAEEFHVNTAHISQLAPFFKGHTSSASELDLAESDYYVFYWNTIQRRREPEVLNRFYSVEEPEHVVRVNGIDYVWIYPNTLYRPVIDYLEERADRKQDIVLVDVNTALMRQYEGPLDLVAVDGAQTEDDIVQELSQVTAGRQRVWFLTFPETPGDPRQLVRHHLEKQAQGVQKITFEGMVLECFELDDEAHFTLPTPTVRRKVRLGKKIHLIGYDLPQRTITDEKPLTVRLYWRTEALLDTSYTVFVHLLGPDGARYGQKDSTPQNGARPTDIWLTDEIIADEYRIDVAEDAPPGAYALAVGMYNWETGERLPAREGQEHLDENRILIEGLYKEETP
ncbi:MAG: phospholipid carrier-dependent glycosyltransferase [Anaerolineae bacterium]